MIKQFFFLLTLVCCVFPGRSQSTNPELVLNTPMHTASIFRMDIQGDMILTAGKDKSAKLWDATTGDLIKTLRIPIDDGNIGYLYAGGLSKNSSLAAVGGWTIDKDIYIFDVATGTMIQRIEDVTGTVHDIEFSPDGKFMVATLCCGNGFYVYELLSNNTLSLYKKVTDFENIIQNVVFNSFSEMFLISYDKTLISYDRYFNERKKIDLPYDKPFGIAISPDDRSLAIGYISTSTIQVYDAKTLKFKHEPSIEGAESKYDAMNKLTYSKDGLYLIATGKMDKKFNGKWKSGIRVWELAGYGDYTDYWVGDGDTATDIKMLGNTTFAYVTTGPSLGIADVYGDNLLEIKGELHSFRLDDRAHLKTNDDGTQFAAKTLDGFELNFNLPDRSFYTNDILGSFSDDNSGLTVTNWKNYTYPSPSFNGTNLTLMGKREICRSADISRSGDKVIFGADWTIYCAKKDGTELWKNSIPGTGWAVNITNNGRLALAALGDGTIRWYDMNNGNLLLSYYLNPNTNKWVLWTESGYYDCSPGAEEYIGWHVNHGEDQEANFFPASKFRNKYYRPDLIDIILSTRDESEALRLANMMNNRRENDTNIMDILPPVVTIVRPYNNSVTDSDQVTIEYTAKSPKGEAITGVKVLVDGRPIENQRGFVKTGTTEKVTITIPKQDVSVSVLAQNQHGWSVAASINLKWNGTPQITAELLKPTLYVLSIGVSDYANDEYDLQFAAKDASDFAESMQRQKGGLYKDVQIKLLTDAGATKDDILDGLDWLQKQTTARDLAMVFIAGHGVNDNVGTFYYLPNNADVENLRRTSLKFDELKYTASYTAGKVIMFVDACHSGGAIGGRRSAPDVNSLVNELSDVESGAVVFTSSTGKQFSLEDPKWGNGAFTEALIEGLNGKADLFGNGSITIKALDAYIAERVKQLTGGKQSPTVVIPQSMPDFAIGVTR